jgi:hypothetical protein
MSALVVNGGGAGIGNELQQFLVCAGIQPGDEASYQVCKTIYEMHPLGMKMAQKPLRIAMSQARDIAIPGSPGEEIKEAFLDEWAKLDVDGHIINVATLARVYGIASCAYGAPNVATNKAIDPTKLAELAIYFNDLDPLNTSGSLVLNQDPNSPDFQKHAAITVAGQAYHRSRSVTIMNEKPIYIAYTTSAFGFVGRSVYQRALYPMKSFIQTMITDDMVTRKAGVLIAKMKPAGSIVNKLMAGAAALKRDLLNESQTGNTISINPEESIETLNMQNVDIAMTVARKNILENIAAADDMPARMLTEETLAEGFGEGSEDAKKEAQYVDRIRKWMQPLYDFFDPIVMYRAWNEEFYATIQAQFPEQYGGVEYMTAFMQWKNAFHVEWPSLLKEPPSEQSKTDKVKLDAIIQLLEALLPALDPENKARIVQAALDNINTLKLLFPTPFELDIDELMAYVPPTPEVEPKPTTRPD